MDKKYSPHESESDHPQICIFDIDTSEELSDEKIVELNLEWVKDIGERIIELWNMARKDPTSGELYCFVIKKLSFYYNKPASPNSFVLTLIRKYFDKQRMNEFRVSTDDNIDDKTADTICNTLLTRFRYVIDSLKSQE